MEDKLTAIMDRLKELNELLESGKGNHANISSMIRINEDILFLLRKGYAIQAYKLPEEPIEVDPSKVFFYQEKK